MVRPFKFTRAFAPAVLVGGGLCAAAMGTTLPGSPPRVANPCSPDGVCLPRHETWGWYETRWRPFPGDVITSAPTPAEEGTEARPLENLGGPQPPGASQEGQTGPEFRPGGGGTGQGTGGAPAPTLPDETTPPADGVLPPVDGLPPLPGTGTPPADSPDAVPDALPDPLDPFGSAPPQPPAWMVENAGFAPLPAAAMTPVAPAVEATAPVVDDGPNLHGDDAPPALPAGLQSMIGGRPIHAPGNRASSTGVTLVQPPSVQVAARPAAKAATASAVITTSADLPLSIPLINPASAIATDPGADGLQQAIYFEATDLPATEATDLPPVIPAN